MEYENASSGLTEKFVTSVWPSILWPVALQKRQTNQPAHRSAESHFSIGHLHWQNFIIYARKVCLLGRRFHLFESVAVQVFR